MRVRVPCFAGAGPHLEDAVDVDARQVDVIGVQLPGTHQLLHLGDADPACQTAAIRIVKQGSEGEGKCTLLRRVLSR